MPAWKNSRPWHRFYDRGVPSSLQYPDVPVHEFLSQSARKFPYAPCTIHQGRSITFQEMDRMTDQMARGLVDLGVRKGDRVGILLPNVPEFVMAYFAILKAGGVVVATNPAYTPPEIEYQVTDSGVGILFAGDGAYEKLKSLRPGSRLKTLICIGATVPAPGDLPLGELGSRSSSGLPDVRPEDTALLQYSGGTTGVSKGAVVLHRNLVANTLQFRAWMTGLEAGRETTLLAIPMYHVYGMVCGMSLSMALGSAMVLIQNPRDLNGLLGSIQE